MPLGVRTLLILKQLFLSHQNSCLEKNASSDAYAGCTTRLLQAAGLGTATEPPQPDVSVASLGLSTASFPQAVKEDYYFQMFYDDLPIWGFIGKLEKLAKNGGAVEYRYYLFTHVHFEISFNGDRIIEINVSTDPSQTIDISEDVIKARSP
jgi:Endomembrane protein 70